NGLPARPDLEGSPPGRRGGYFRPGIGGVVLEAPVPQVGELESAAEYYEFDCESDNDILQEIPDTIGTHAVLSGDGFKTLTLKEVLSWRLHADGAISGMLVDDDKVVNTPALPGDECLFPAEQHADFRYFFHHHIANRIKAHDPEAMAAISPLVEP